MARINDKKVIERLEEIALVDPPHEASLRAVERARQAVVQQQPVRQPRFSRRFSVFVACAAALLVLIPMAAYLRHKARDPVNDAPAVTGPLAREPVVGPSGPAATAEKPVPGALPAPGRPDLPSEPSVARVTPPGSYKPSPSVVVGGKPLTRELNRPPDNRLELDERQGDEDLLAEIKRLPETVWVNVSRSKVSAAGLVHLKLLKSVARVELDRDQVTPEGVRQLQAIKDLEYLGVRRSDDEAAEYLAELTNLKGLALSYTEGLTDAGVAPLAAMKKLERLSLNTARRVGDAGLGSLANLMELRELDLHGTAVTDAGLVHLEALRHLERLTLNNQITDEGLRHIARLTSLKELQLGGSLVTDAGLVHLSGLTELWSLGIQHLDVSDAGLQHLKPLKKLMQLGLKGTRVSAAAVEKFRRELPHKTPSTFGEQ